MLAQARHLLLGGIAGKLLGFGRELVSAALFGTGVVASAFRLSQSAYLIPLQGFMSEALNAGFIPAFTRRRSSVEDACSLYAGMHFILLLMSTVGAVVLLIMAETWVRFLAPGFSAEALSLSTHMVQIMAVSLPAYMLGSLYAAVEHAYGQSGYMATRASAQSLGLILGSLAAWLLGNPLLLAGFFTLTQLILAFWGWRLVGARDLRIRRGLAQGHAAVLSALKPVGAAVASLIWVPVVMQVHFVVERRVASVVAPQALASLDYARFISDTAVLLLAMPLGMAGLAAMSTMNEEQFEATCLKAIKGLLFVGAPLSAFLYANAPFVVQLLFQRGAFDAESARITSSILKSLSIGLWAQLIAYASLKFLSARGQNAKVLMITIAGVLINIAINSGLSRVLGVSTLGYAAAANSLLMLAIVFFFIPGIRKTLKSFLALAVATIIYLPLSGWVPGNLPKAVVGGLYWSAFILAWPDSRNVIFSVLQRKRATP